MPSIQPAAVIVVLLCSSAKAAGTGVLPNFQPSQDAAESSRGPSVQAAAYTETTNIVEGSKLLRAPKSANLHGQQHFIMFSTINILQGVSTSQGNQLKSGNPHTQSSNSTLEPALLPGSANELPVCITLTAQLAHLPARPQKAVYRLCKERSVLEASQHSFMTALLLPAQHLGAMVSSQNSANPANGAHNVAANDGSRIEKESAHNAHASNHTTTSNNRDFSNDSISSVSNESSHHSIFRNNVASNDAATGTAQVGRSGLMLLTIHAEQQRGGQAYFWAGSKIVLQDAASTTMNIDMNEYSYSWPVAMPTPTAASAAAVPVVAAPYSSDVSDSNTSSSNVRSSSSRVVLGNSHAAFEAKSQLGTQPQKQQHQQQQQQHHYKQPDAASTCMYNSLGNQLCACAAKQPEQTAYALSALIDNQPAMAAWLVDYAVSMDVQSWSALRTGSTLSSSKQQISIDSNSGSTQVHKATSQFVSLVAMCPAWTNQTQAANVRQMQGQHTLVQQLAAMLNGHVPAANDAASNVPSRTFQYHNLSGQVQINTTATQLLLAVAACAAAWTAIVLTLRACFIGTRAVDAHKGLNSLTAGYSAGKRHHGTATVHAKQRGDGLSLHGRQVLGTYDVPAAYDTLLQLDQDLAAAADYEDPDPFGYGTAGNRMAGAVQELTVATAVRRVSAVAAGHAAGALKAAFAGKGKNNAAAAAAASSSWDTVNGTNISADTVQQASMAGRATAANGSRYINEDSASKAAALAAGYWDEADEEAVNKLPANIQEHLQAAGRWTRGTGGRLVRGSLCALKRVSGVAAAAVMEAAGLQAGGDGAAAGFVGRGSDVGGMGQYTGTGVSSMQKQGIGQNGGSASAGADEQTLRRLMAALPGTEIDLE